MLRQAQQPLLIIKIIIKMREEKNQNCNTHTSTGSVATKVELQVIPNNESKADCGGKLILTITCDGAKLTKADAGYNSEFTQEIWAGAKRCSTKFASG